MLVETTEDELAGEKWEKSGLIDVSNPGDIQFICQTESKASRKFFNLNITLQNGFMFLNLEEQNSSDSSILLKNNTENLILEIEQKGIKNTSFQVVPKAVVPFSWIEPFEEKCIDVKVIHHDKPVHQFTIEIDKIGEIIDSEFQLDGRDKLISYKVNLEGSSRVIRFFSIRIERKQSSFNIVEEIDLIRAKIPAFGFSIISAAGEKKVELLYIKLSPVEFVLEKKDNLTSFHLRIKSLKIDNNSTEDQIYPLMVFPENTAKLDRGVYPFLDFIFRFKNRTKPTDVSH
jgi:SHR-binding domain of vacuolar-sorting associated protein 13